MSYADMKDKNMCKNASTESNAIVKKVAEINISGNIIAPMWYKTICFANGRPDLLAISILGDIYYWYRPKASRNSHDRETEKYLKKFSGDLLQRSYRQLENQFGASKKQIRRAIKNLCDLGVIEKILRNQLTSQGVIIPNVMFLKLNPERLMELTRPDAIRDKRNAPTNDVETAIEDINTSQNAHTSNYPVTETIPSYSHKGNHYVAPKGIPSAMQVNTYTKTTAQITCRDFCQSSSDEGDDVETYKQLIANNIRLNDLRHSILLSDYDKTLLDAIYSVICEVVCYPRSEVTIRGAQHPGEIVKGQLLKLSKDNIINVINSVSNVDEIKDQYAYLISALYIESLSVTDKSLRQDGMVQDILHITIDMTDEDSNNGGI